METFNQIWARRVLTGGAVVLIISDGLDTGDIELLTKESSRLHRSCHKLIWLNPNLGFEAYEPITKGVQSILPNVDNFLPIHNLDSLIELGSVLDKLDKRQSFRAMA